MRQRERIRVKTHHTVEVYRGNTTEYSGNEITETKAQQCIKYSVTCTGPSSLAMKAEVKTFPACSSGTSQFPLRGDKSLSSIYINIILLVEFRIYIIQPLIIEQQHTYVSS